MDKLFILWLAASPTDQDIAEAQLIEAFPSDFLCSEAEADLERKYPDAHVFCADLADSIRLVNGDVYP